MISLRPYLAFCAVLSLACARTARPQAPAMPASNAPQFVMADSAFEQFFSAMRVRWVNNSKVPDEETVLCLYGTVRNDTAFISFTRPTVIKPMGPALVAFQKCGLPNPAYFGILRFLGTWHPHNGGVDCGFSWPDTESFISDERAVIDVVSCSRGMIWRAK